MGKYILPIFSKSSWSPLADNRALNLIIWLTILGLLSNTYLRSITLATLVILFTLLPPAAIVLSIVFCSSALQYSHSSNCLIYLWFYSYLNAEISFMHQMILVLLLLVSDFVIAHSTFGASVYLLHRSGRIEWPLLSLQRLFQLPPPPHTCPLKPTLASAISYPTDPHKAFSSYGGLYSM